MKGDEVCLGLDEIAQAFIHPQTTRNQGLIKLIVEEVRSHKELRNISFTSIRIAHNTISAPHTGKNLRGYPSVAIGVGHYAGGRLRIAGAKQPINIRDHALVFDGLKNTR